jgi:hypothetical protein
MSFQCLSHLESRGDCLAKLGRCEDTYQAMLTYSLLYVYVLLYAANWQSQYQCQLHKQMTALGDLREL